jgi:hypothetical protein
LSDKLRKRALVAMMTPIPVIVGYAIVVGTDNHAGGLFAMFLVAAGKSRYPEERTVELD